MLIKSGIIGLILFFSAVSAYAGGSKDKENKKPLALQPSTLKPLTPQKRMIEGGAEVKIASKRPKPGVDSVENPMMQFQLSASILKPASSMLKPASKAPKLEVVSDVSSMMQFQLPALISIKEEIIEPVVIHDVLHVENLEEKPINFTENAKWQTCFTPQQKCVDFLISFLNKAKESIYLQAYVLSSRSIADALVTAHNRGVEVKVLVDNSQLAVSYSKISFLSRNSVPVYVDVNATLAHNKVIVIDKEMTITGSYNLSDAAEKTNIENLIAIEDPKVARTYLDNYITRYEHCLRYDNNDPSWVQLQESPTRPKSISIMRAPLRGDLHFYQVDAF